MQQIGLAVDQPVAGRVAAGQRADRDGFARLLAIAGGLRGTRRQQRRHVAQHERRGRGGGHAPLPVHDQGQVPAAQIARHLRCVELDGDRPERRALRVLDPAGHEIRGAPVQPRDAERMAAALAQSPHQIGSARVDHAHDAARVRPVAGRHGVVRQVVHVDAGVVQILRQRQHEVADLAHQRIAGELGGALLARQLGGTRRVGAIAQCELNHIALAGDHVGDARHLGEQPVHDARRGLGFLLRTGRQTIHPAGHQALRCPPAHARHQRQPEGGQAQRDPAHLRRHTAPFFRAVGFAHSRIHRSRG